MRQIVFATLLILLAMSANSATTPSTVEAPLAQPIKVTPPHEHSRIDRLEDQFAIVREYNDDFISVVIGALGAVGTITIVLIGFNWFQSTRALKKEFDVFRNEIEGSLATSSTQLSYAIDTRLGELEKKLRTIAGEVTEEKSAKLRSEIRWLKSNVLELQYKSIEAEVKYWQKYPVPANAVNTCAQLIESAITMDTNWRISDAIELLNESLDLLNKETTRLDVQDLLDLEATVEKLPSSHKSAQAAILRRLERLHKT